MLKSYHKHRVIILILISLIAIFIFSLFKNIAYPLLWNDEAETAMYGERIIRYGYPKVHDGKNVLYLANVPQDIGINKGLDAYLQSVWGQYYFAAPAVALSHLASDIYTKTAIVRFPFALIGLIGLALIALSVRGLFNDNKADLLLFFIIFTFFELLSVPLKLHLREVRCYSLAIFFIGYILFVYVKAKFILRIPALSSNCLLVILLVGLFNTFPPACLSLIITIVLFEGLEFMKYRRIKQAFINLLPVFISIFIVTPFVFFHRSLLISQIYTRALDLNYSVIFSRIILIFSFFAIHDFLIIAFFIKVLLIVVWFYGWRSFPDCISQTQRLRLKVSILFSIFFIVHTFIASRIPLNYIFQRYFIFLQPVLIVTMLLDIFIIVCLLEIVLDLKQRRKALVVFICFICVIFAVSIANKAATLKNHAYELFNQYKGPLDFVIPYIRSNYKNTQDLIIATNYEECSYMYYLGSRVIVGLVINNLEEDLKLQPDIIIFRKGWDFLAPYFVNFFNRGSYRRVSFPVFDYPVNNIPQLGGGLPHLFKTLEAKNQADALDMYTLSDSHPIDAKNE